jgi:hypothetical protein
LEFTGQASVPGFCAAAESASPPGFKTSSAIVHSEGGTISAASPMFRTTYRLDTSLSSALRRPMAVLERLAPTLIALPLVGL